MMIAAIINDTTTDWYDIEAQVKPQEWDVEGQQDEQCVEEEDAMIIPAVEDILLCDKIEELFLLQAIEEAEWNLQAALSKALDEDPHFDVAGSLAVAEPVFDTVSDIVEADESVIFDMASSVVINSTTVFDTVSDVAEAIFDMGSSVVNNSTATTTDASSVHDTDVVPEPVFDTELGKELAASVLDTDVVTSAEPVFDTDLEEPVLLKNCIFDMGSSVRDLFIGDGLLDGACCVASVVEEALVGDIESGCSALDSFIGDGLLDGACCVASVVEEFLVGDIESGCSALDSFIGDGLLDGICRVAADSGIESSTVMEINSTESSADAESVKSESVESSTVMEINSTADAKSEPSLSDDDSTASTASLSTLGDDDEEVVEEHTAECQAPLDPSDGLIFPDNRSSPWEIKNSDAFAKYGLGVNLFGQHKNPHIHAAHIRKSKPREDLNALWKSHTGPADPQRCRKVSFANASTWTVVQFFGEPFSKLNREGMAAMEAGQKREEDKSDVPALPMGSFHRMWDAEEEARYQQEVAVFEEYYPFLQHYKAVFAPIAVEAAHAAKAKIELAQQRIDWEARGSVARVMDACTYFVVGDYPGCGYKLFGLGGSR